ncbi:hypothetical protein ALPO108162_07365 [Alicyclobacillus pomorum]
MVPTLVSHSLRRYPYGNSCAPCFVRSAQHHELTDLGIHLGLGKDLQNFPQKIDISRPGQILFPFGFGIYYP